MKKIYLLFFSLCYLFSAGQELDANIHEINYLGGLDARNIIKHDNKLIFAGAEIFESVANQNYELWGYDYNSKKTTLIKELRPLAATPFSGNPYFTIFKDKVFFIADMGNNRELWSTDGTTSGTQKIFDLGNSYILNVAANDNRLLITSNYKVFVSDGTAQGSSVLKEFPDLVSEEKPFVFGSYFIFAAKNQNFSTKLWITNGADEPSEIKSSSDNYSLAIFDKLECYNLNGTLLFYGAGANNTQSGLYRYNETAKKADLIYVTNGVSSGQILNDQLIFKGWEQPYGGSLFATDGTAENTKRLSNEPNIVTPLSNQNHLQKVGNQVYFFRSIGGAATLWKTDGTAAGTKQTSITIPGEFGADILKHFSENDLVLIENSGHNKFWLMNSAENLTALGELRLSEGIESANSIIFPYQDLKYGRELFQYNLQTNAVSLFADGNHKDSSSPTLAPNATENGLVMTASTSPYDRQFYVIKSKNKAPELLQAATSGQNLVPKGKLFQVGNYSYVKPDEYTSIIAKSDGTSANTRLFGLPGSATLRDYSAFGNLRNEALIIITPQNSGEGSIRIIRNDINSNLFPTLKEIPAGSTMSELQAISYNGAVYFTTYTADYKTEIWKTDGTSSGTTLALTIPDDPNRSNKPRLLKVFDNHLLISKNTRLWAFDGNTDTLKEIPFPSSDEPWFFGEWNISPSMAEANGSLYLVTQNGSGKVFRFDNLQSAPTEILDAMMGPYSVLSTCGNTIYFGTGTNGKVATLRSIDSITNEVKEIISNSENGLSAFTCVKDYLYFLKENSNKIWRTNGTAESIVSLPIRVTNEDQITADDSLLSLKEFDNTLYFTAQTQTSGIELYTIATELPVYLTTNEISGATRNMKLVLYPNPASDFINIKSSAKMQPQSYRVFDISGKQLLHGSYQQKAIDISRLSSGLYVIEVVDGTGTAYSQKFIKK